MVKSEEEPRRIRKKAAAHKLIVATAIELFSRHGFESVTVEHIADVADVGKGTIYNYFQTKEDIVVAFMVEKEKSVQARLSHMTTMPGSLASVLEKYILYQFRLKQPFHRFVRVFMGQMFHRTEHFIPYMLEMQNAIDLNLEKLFRSLQQRGLMRTDIAIPTLVTVFKTMHLGLTALWAVEGPPFRGTTRVARQEIAIFCQGLEVKER